MTTRRLSVFGLLLLVAFGAWWLQSRPTDDGPNEPSDAPSRAQTRAPEQGPQKASSRSIAVLDEEGRPVAGAVIRAVGDAPLLRVANTDGRMDWPGGGERRIVAAAPGFLPRAMLLRADTDSIELRRGGYDVSGQVRDLYGGVVPGALVGVPGGAAARTDDDGRYALTLPSGTWRIHATSEDYFGQSRVLRVTAAASQDFELFPGGAIEGVVVDEDGAPCPDAWVSYSVLVPRSQGYEHRPATDERRVRADPRGHFRLAPLEPATYRLLAHTASASAQAPTSVRLALLETRSDLTLVVEPGSTQTGQVLDDRGEPVEAMRIVATHRAGYALEARTGADGRFALGGLHPGTWRVSARRGRGSVGEIVETQISHGEEPEPLASVVERTATLRGVADDGAGARITLGLPEAAMSFADLRRRGAVRDIEATADDDGSFVLEGIPAGAWQVFATTSEGRSGSGVITLEPGRDHAIDIDLEAPVTLHGTLSNRGGDTDGFQVRLRGATPMAAAPVGEAGDFEIANVPHGSWTLGVEHHGTAVPLLEGASTVRIDSGAPPPLALVVDTAKAMLRGRVEDSEGQPVADALVEVAGDQPEPTLAISDGNGRFEVPSSTAARYRVDVTGPSGLGLAHADDLPADADLVLTLQQPAAVYGHVRLHGAPVRRFEVAPPGSGLIPVLFADERGTFELTDLQPGPARLAVYAPDGVAYARLELRPGVTTELDLELEPWATASGRVVDEDGAAVSGASVDVSSQAPRADGSLPATTDDDGAFEIGGIGPGRTVFEIRDGPRTLRLDARVVEPGDAVELGVLALTGDG